MAQSLVLSTGYYDEDTDQKPDKRYLREVSRMIKAGECIDWDEHLLEQLIGQQVLLDYGGSPSWLQVAMLLVVMFTIPLIALIIFLLRNF